jgi:hypothetical protein
MTKGLKELVLLIGAFVMGMVLLFISISHADYLGLGIVSWGYPLAWHTTGGDVTVLGGPLVSGVYWFYLGLDLAFWLALSLAAIEGSFHVAIPYVRRKLMIRRTKRSAVPTSANIIQTPNVSA